MNEQDIFEVRQTDAEIQEILDQVPKNKKAIEDINGKLPEEASPENPLADKEYVDGKVGEEANARQEAVNAERTRAEGAEQTLQGNIDAEAASREQADQTLDGKIGANTQAIAAEKTRAEGAEQTLDGKIAANTQAITAEKTRAEGVEQTLDGKIAGNTQAITAIQEAIKAFVNSEQVQTLINTALQPYSTTTEMNAAISAAITSALTAYYTKTATDELLSNKVDKVSGKQLSTEDFTTALKTKLDALPTAADLSTQISTAISTALEAYYNKTQVDNLLAPKQTAEQVSSAIAAALTSYSTTTQMNAAISSALAAYYTKTEIDAALQSINTAIGQKASQADLTSTVSRVFFVEKSFGKYDGEREITLQQAKAGRYVNTDGSETTANGYGISAPITLNAGDILLVPSAQAVPASVSVVARLVDRTYQKVIAYIYTYREDYPELPATATADYDASLVYTAVYDESGDTPTLTGWTRAGQTYTTLPATREVSEQFYEPLVRQAVSAMPSTGYYIYLSPTAMTVVVSGLTATVSGGKALVVGWGIFKNITTNFVGAPGQSVLAQAFAVLFAAIDGLKAQLDNLGETKAVSIDFENSPKLCGQDMFLTGDGAPAAPNVPTMVGQEYLDITNKKCYKAFSVTNSISDWVLLN